MVVLKFGFIINYNLSKVFVKLIWKFELKIVKLDCKSALSSVTKKDSAEEENRGKREYRWAISQGKKTWKKYANIENADEYFQHQLFDQMCTENRWNSFLLWKLERITFHFIYDRKSKEWNNIIIIKDIITSAWQNFQFRIQKPNIFITLGCESVYFGLEILLDWAFDLGFGFSIFWFSPSTEFRIKWVIKDNYYKIVMFIIVNLSVSWWKFQW